VATESKEGTNAPAWPTPTMTMLSGSVLAFTIAAAHRRVVEPQYIADYTQVLSCNLSITYKMQQT
jgi:hypothetical protein